MVLFLSSSECALRVYDYHECQSDEADLRPEMRGRLIWLNSVSPCGPNRTGAINVNIFITNGRLDVKNSLIADHYARIRVGKMAQWAGKRDWLQDNRCRFLKSRVMQWSNL